MDILGIQRIFVGIEDGEFAVHVRVSGKGGTGNRNPWYGTEGFWISADGTFREVRDHFNEVKGDPKAFGFTEAEAATWDIRRNRENVLIAAMRKGFIRVRGHKDYTTFELWKVADRDVSHMKRFVDKFAFYPEEDVSIHELSSHKAWNGDMRKLKYLSADRFNEDKK